jgi:hypothetical protein
VSDGLRVLPCYTDQGGTVQAGTTFLPNVPVSRSRSVGVPAFEREPRRTGQPPCRTPLTARERQRTRGRRSCRTFDRCRDRDCARPCRPQCCGRRHSRWHCRSDRERPVTSRCPRRHNCGLGYRGRTRQRGYPTVDRVRAFPAYFVWLRAAGLSRGPSETASTDCTAHTDASSDSCGRGRARRVPRCRRQATWELIATASCAEGRRGSGETHTGRGDSGVSGPMTSASPRTRTRSSTARPGPPSSVGQEGYANSLQL